MISLMRGENFGSICLSHMTMDFPFGHAYNMLSNYTSDSD